MFMLIKIACWLTRHAILWDQWSEPRLCKSHRGGGVGTLYERVRCCKCGRRVHKQTLKLKGIARTPGAA